MERIKSMEKTKLKNQKAITLIALVITIIVLIILVGVTISLVIGNNGMVNKTNSAKIKTDIVKIGYLTYICDLAYQTAKQNNSTNIYKLLISSIERIEEGLDPLIITNIFELKMLDYLGVGIDLDRCIKCGNQSNIITINGDEGGYICKDCHTNEIIYDIKTIKMFRLYYYVEIDSIKDLKISKEVVNNINTILTEYYDRYTGLYLKSKEFLKEITK